MNIKVIELRLGDMDTNCYIVYEDISKNGVIIDPGDDASFISEILERKGISPKLILATHGHSDHLMAVYDLKLIYKIPFAGGIKDEFLINKLSYLKRKAKINTSIKVPKIDRNLKEGDMIKVNGNCIKVLETPGHTPGSLSYHLKEAQLVFIGDIMFADGSLGRYDLEYSNKQVLEKSIKRILKLEAGTKVYCGHGEVSTVSKMRRFFKYEHYV